VPTHDAVRGFEAAADAYDRARPEYPEEAVDLVARVLELAPGRRLLELGAGTGKFSRLAAARGATVVATEPAEAMIRRAKAVPGVLPVRAVAEALPVRPHAADAACAASAFHWFDGRRGGGGGAGPPPPPARAAFDHARDLFRPLEEARFRHVHPLTPAGVVERIASVSFIAALDAAERDEVLDEVRAVLASHPDVAGRDELPLAYLTDVFLWQRV
jgi:SAM-dependent methyltransferase